MTEGVSASVASTCDPHAWVWTWPIEGGGASIGVCSLCQSITTAERDEQFRYWTTHLTLVKVRELAERYDSAAQALGPGANGRAKRAVYLRCRDELRALVGDQ